MLKKISGFILVVATLLAISYTGRLFWESDGLSQGAWGIVMIGLIDLVYLPLDRMVRAR